MADNNPNVILRKKAYEPGTDSTSGVITFDTNEKKIYLDGDVYGEQNVQSDWNEIGTASPSYILNKPTITNVGRVLCFGEFDEALLLPMQLKAVEPNSTVMLIANGSLYNMEYSYDGETWSTWNASPTRGQVRQYYYETLTLENVGDTVYLRGSNPNGLDAWFELTGKIAAGGNMQSLVDGESLTYVAKKMPRFSNWDDDGIPNTALVSAPKLPATTLVAECYVSMFSGCTALTQAPSLPATVLAEACYDGMFNGCTSLTTAAAMPAVTTIGENGCGRMYIGCTSLTSAAAMPAVTTIGIDGCSAMYFRCTSLTAAAAMPAVTTIGENGCGGMYQGCTSLTSAAAMPAVTTIGKGGCVDMYNGCTFNMSNDGITLNFAFPTPPITTTGDDPRTYATAYEIAEWMGNTNGFGIS